LEHHAEIFKDRFFIELQLHEQEEQQAVNKELIRIANKYNWPLIITNDCHYTHEDDKHVHEVALCIQTNDVMSNPNRFSFGDIDVHVATHDTLWKRAQAQGIPYEAISNTLHVAAMIDSSTYFSDRKNRYTKFPDLPEGIPSWKYLAIKCKEALFKRMGGMPPKEYRDRIDYELSVIKRMGFSDYLLIVQDYLNMSRSEGIWIGPGRGSAAGSLIAYALGITQVDPIKYNLLFERFLNEGRAATPLIFSNNMLEQAKQHVHTCKGCNHEHE
jgi:DNA polymerase-3 subunit alpha